MWHQGVFTAVAPAGPSRYGIERMPERVQMNHISLPNGFIEHVNRAGGSLEDSWAAYWEDLGVDALTKRVLQIRPVIVAVKRRRDNGGVPSLRRHE